MSERKKQLPMNNKNLASKLTYMRKLYAPWQLTQTSLKQFNVVNYSLKIHKSAYHLFSVFISKRGFSFMQKRETFGESLSGNHGFLRPGIRLVTSYYCIRLTSFTLLCNKSIVFQVPRLLITSNRLALVLPIGSDYVSDH